MMFTGGSAINYYSEVAGEPLSFDRAEMFPAATILPILLFSCLFCMNGTAELNDELGSPERPRCIWFGPLKSVFSLLELNRLEVECMALMTELSIVVGY